LVNAVRHSCRRCEIPPNLVEPLFYTCWMHRALKESTRRVASNLQGGHYVNLLRMCIEKRQSAALRRLFAAGQEAAR
jgi:hypothetical protein